MTTHTLTHATDLDGKAVVGVGIPNRAITAWLYQDDYNRIAALHPDGRWSTINNGSGQSYVRVRMPGDHLKSVYVARFIMGNIPGSGIQYHDQDRLNLRQANLFVGEGRGGVTQKARKRPFKAFRITATGDVPRADA